LSHGQQASLRARVAFFLAFSKPQAACTTMAASRHFDEVMTEAMAEAIAEATAKAEEFKPPVKMKSWIMTGAGARTMTSLVGSFMGSPAQFVVDQDVRCVELFELFYSEHFLSAVTQAVNEAYPKSGKLALQFSPKMGLEGAHDDTLADQTVGVFVFCQRTRKLVGAVHKNALRLIAQAFLARSAARI
jgi:hypothetical protein